MAGAYSRMLLATAQPVIGAAGVVLIVSLELSLEVVEMTDVLDMGYKALLELNVLLGLEMRLVLVLSAVAELLAVVLSLRLVESPGLDVAAVAPPLELLPPRLEGMFALEGLSLIHI